MNTNDKHEVSQLSEDEMDVDIIDPKPIKPIQSSLDIFAELSSLMQQLDIIDANFNEKDKQYEKDKKEFQINRKRTHKDFEQLRKKFEKTLNRDMNRIHKTRKTGNSGKGGFNKIIPVPKKLCLFLELESGSEMSRPSVTHLLNEKFKQMKFRSEENGKLIKITDKDTATILGCELDHTIAFNQFQGFIAKFYNDEKLVLL